MRLRSLLFMLITYGCVCQADKSCAKLPLCNCTKTSGFQVDVDCHNTELSLAETCRLCERIKHVRYLDVSENRLKHIPASCFKDCSELEVLSLATNNLSLLTKQAFTGLKNLRVLNLDDNTLIQRNGEVSDPNLFQVLTNLQSLLIQKNRKVPDLKDKTMYLSNIANDTLTKLQSLHLDGVANAEFGTNFLTFTNLTNVSFSGKTANCYMSVLASSTFQNVPYIEKLCLSHCNISFVDALTFEPLKRLKILDMSYNMALGFSSLRNVSYGFRNSRNMEVLDYSKVYKTFGLTTQLNRCDVWFLQNTSLKELRLNSNRLASIEINAAGLFPPTIEVIHLEDNKLTYGPYTLQGGCMSTLKRLELSGQDSVHSMLAYNNELHIEENNIDTSGECHVNKSSLKSNCWLSKNETLHWGKFTFPKALKTLNARESNFKYESNQLQYPFPNELLSIDMSNNLIYKWTDPFILFRSLKELNLSKNFCSNISGSFFFNFPNIESLDASNNKLGPVLVKDINGSIFRNLSSLKVLDISNNWIEYLHHNIFIYNELLETLDISLNQIENISFNYEHMKNLTALSLRQNKISSLPIKLLEQMNVYSRKSDKNMTIDLSENILDASDCDNLGFLSWMISHPDVFVNIDSYKFYTGRRVKKTYAELLLSYKQIEQNCSRKRYGIYIVVSSLFITIVSSIIVGAIVYRYRWRLRYLYYMAKARHNGYIPIRDTEEDKEYQYDIFISYSTDDYQFVTGEMYNKLDDAGFSLCLHQKDFIPGNDIAENIVQAVRNSRQTLIVLSPAFLESKWCIYEFNMARMESVYSRDGTNVILIVMYENVDITRVSPEMRDCLESESYLAFPLDEGEKPYFWQILVQALGSPSGRT